MARGVLNRRAWGIGALLLLALFYALGTGFPFFFQFLYALALLLAAGAAWAWLNLRGLEVSVSHSADRGYVGGYLTARVSIHNRHWLPKSWLEVADATGIAAASGGRGLSLKRGQPRAWQLQTYLARRGVFHTGRVRVLSRDPFGLFQMGRDFTDARRYVVYPAIHPLPQLDPPLAGLPAGRRRARRFDAVATDVASLRDYRPGDAFRRIHWPYTARMNAPMVKEFDIDQSSEAWLVLDLHAASHPGAAAADGDSGIRNGGGGRGGDGGIRNNDGGNTGGRRGSGGLTGWLRNGDGRGGRIDGQRNGDDGNPSQRRPGGLIGWRRPGGNGRDGSTGGQRNGDDGNSSQRRPGGLIRWRRNGDGGNATRRRNSGGLIGWRRNNGGASGQRNSDDSGGPDGNPPPALDDSSEELAVSVAASLAYRMLELELPAGLAASGPPGLMLRPGSSPEHLARLLELLAQAQTGQGPPLAEFLYQLRPQLNPFHSVTVITTAAAPAASWASALAGLRQRGASVAAIIIDTDAPSRPAGTNPTAAAYPSDAYAAPGPDAANVYDTAAAPSAPAAAALQTAAAELIPAYIVRPGIPLDAALSAAAGWRGN